MPQALTDRQRKFCEAYVLNGGNGTAAAREAGYSGTDAVLAVTATRTLGASKVRQYLDSLNGKAIAKAERKTGRVIASLAQSLANATAIMDVDPTELLGDDGEVNMAKVREMDPMKRRCLAIEIQSTTDEKGQAFTRHKIKRDPVALAATKLLVDHYDGANKPAQGQTNVLVQLVQQGDPKVLPVMRALLSAGAIDVEAREVDG